MREGTRCCAAAAAISGRTIDYAWYQIAKGELCHAETSIRYSDWRARHSAKKPLDLNHG
ncbi:hypothetical protein AGR7C_Lc20123 [Agrobacterium deltaense Zutra 3/1]|uniref:Uncharacterized protein n=1 Tax=Agrobacterium deltaense Zutra 3/1 TaxID=1183427 RepID=A0A1S7RLN9_9HYPH|nr:hypothetical protein AGR7C_Lc20123 [Agrobacterium deltaense Zutra 3/1]